MKSLESFFTPINSKSGSEKIKLSKLDEKYKLARSIATWFSLDLLPFNECGRDGFKTFCKLTNIVQEYEQIPDPSTIRKTALEDVYNYTHKKIVEKLQNVPSTLSITFDAWTDNYKRLSYITFTVHWIDENWILKQATLQTAYFPRPHTGENIKTRFIEVQKEFGLKEKIFESITDGKKNMIKACRLLEMDRNYCVAHSLHNLITKDLLSNVKELEPILKKLRSIHHALIFQNEFLLKLFQEKQKADFLQTLEEIENIGKQHVIFNILL